MIYFSAHVNSATPNSTPIPTSSPIPTPTSTSTTNPTPTQTSNPTPDEWKIIERNVCFGARGNTYGEFTHQNEGFLSAIKLEHVSGGVTCATRYNKTDFGCDDDDDYISVFITDTGNRYVFPNNVSRQKYRYKLDGYSAHYKNLVFRNSVSPPDVQKGTQIRISYGADLFGYAEYNNHGTSRVDVYGRFEN